MPVFSATQSNGVTLHRGDPGCQAAHDALLATLKRMKTPFIAPSGNITVSQQGNLGEFIAFQVAMEGTLGSLQAFAHNAVQPLSGISGAGVDIMYVYFDANDDSLDALFIQEVKTTVIDNISLFDVLRKDYEKLFSLDISKTLQSRISYLANAFEFERKSVEHADRVLALGGTKPELSTKVRLLPTGIHTLDVGNPEQKMLAVRAAIASLGWKQSSIMPWTIALGDLGDRIIRLARGMA